MQSAVYAAGVPLVSVAPVGIWIVFCAVCAMAAVLSVVFYYHWNKYGADIKAIAVVHNVYGIITVGMVVILLLFALSASGAAF